MSEFDEEFGMLPGGIRGKGGIYFCVGRREHCYSYLWRIGWSRTSFYLKARNAAFADLKVSLHGADERHGATGHSFKIGYDSSAASAEDQRLSVATPGFLPRWFQGKEVSEIATHVLRLRFPHDTFVDPLRSAPVPGSVRQRDFAGLIRPPHGCLYVVDVDLFVSRGKPYRPNREAARRERAGMGPIESEAGDFLTAVNTHRLILNRPTPVNAQAPSPLRDSDGIRGVGMAVDNDDVLWIVEQWMSRTALESGQPIPARQHPLRPFPLPRGVAVHVDPTRLRNAAG